MADDSDFKSSRGSWFGQYRGDNVWHDPGDNGQNKSGLPQSTPGIALPRSDTLGHYYEIVAPNNRRMVVRQVDEGPSWKATHRGIDINASAAEMAGYTPKNFPTNDSWKYRYIGEKLPSGMNEGIQVGASTTRVATGPRSGTQRYWEQGRAAPTANARVAGDFKITDVPNMLQGAGTFEGGKPKGMIWHWTSGHEKDGQAVADELRGKGLGVQYVIDRGADGTGKNPRVWRLTPEGRTAHHFLPGWGEKGAGLSYKNMAGVEMVGDPTGESGPKTPITPEMQAAAGQLAGWHSSKYGYDPAKMGFGHGEVNPGHREAEEGMPVVSRLRAGTLPLSATQVASAAPKPGTSDYWNQGKGKGGAQSIDVAKVSGAGPNAKIAQAGNASAKVDSATADAKVSEAAANAKVGKSGDDATKVAQSGANAKVASADDNAKVGATKDSGAGVHEAGANAAVSEPKRAQLADAGSGPKTGSSAYWRGREHSDATHIAQGDQARPTGDGSARSHLPHGAGGHEPQVGDDGTAHSVAASATADNEPWQPSVTGVSFEGGAGGVPKRVVIEMTVHAQPV